MRFGSPTILVDGCDVAPSDQPTAANCRVYPLATGGFDRAPSIDAIEKALRGAAHAEKIQNDREE
jgi:hypothetical protein